MVDGLGGMESDQVAVGLKSFADFSLIEQDRADWFEVNQDGLAFTNLCDSVSEIRSLCRREPALDGVEVNESVNHAIFGRGKLLGEKRRPQGEFEVLRQGLGFEASGRNDGVLPLCDKGIAKLIVGGAFLLRLGAILRPLFRVFFFLALLQIRREAAEKGVEADGSGGGIEVGATAAGLITFNCQAKLFGKVRGIGAVDAVNFVGKRYCSLT
jgi:hypothetical protein